jgi:hypothetical protein
MADYRFAFHELKELELILAYSDSTLDADNFDNPITKVINAETRIRIDMQVKKYFDFFIGNLSVTTKYGIFYPFSSTVSSFYMADSYHDSTSRIPGYTSAITIDKDDPPVIIPDQYAIIRI